MNVALALASLLEGSFAGFVAAVAGSSPLSVPRRMPLEAYLSQVRRIPLWQQRLFMDHAIVDVERTASDGNKTRLAEIRLETVLESGDEVRLRDSDPGYVAALRAKARLAVDYALLAARDDDDDFLRLESQLIEQRGATLRTDHDINPSATLEQFVVNLGQGSPLDLPVRDLHLISHASPFFDLNFSVARPQGLDDSVNTDVVSWESIEQAPERLRVPDEYLLPTAQRLSEPPKLFVRACGMGRAAGLLEKLRQAMNPRLRVHAPMHFLGVKTAGREPVGDGLFAFQDYFEYMCQVHWVASGRELTRDELLDRLRPAGAAPRLDADGKPLPSGVWDGLVPAAPWDLESELVGEVSLAFQMPEFRLPGGQLVRSAPMSFAIGGMYRFEFSEELNVPTTATKADFMVNRIEALRAAIHAHPDPRSNLHPAHGLPIWKRDQFETADEFIDTVAFSQITFDESGSQIKASCSGVLYGVLLPVLAKGIAPVAGRRTLAVNYYPEGAKTPAVELMRLNDPKFWATVG
jgi:hypothetical protein